MRDFKQVLYLIDFILKTRMDGYLFILDGKIVYSQIDSSNPEIREKIVVKRREIPRNIFSLIKFSLVLLKKAREYQNGDSILKNTPIIIEKWKTEGDFFEISSNGYHLVVNRPYPLGCLCGYVGVPKTHSFFGKADDTVYDLECHGGVTYIGNNLPFMNKNYWYIGFDCGHSFDYVPEIKRNNIDQYRDMEYVMEENRKLFYQLTELYYPSSKTGINLNKKALL